ncbi:MAG: TetR/AcrR family transcriptional regulator [Clostridia bacterium]|nr:TetR/AcrR family transcriptional regulator [Clostridia bacterium]
MATDRRVKYTKKVLGEALIKFLNEKPIARITVKEICEEADINRATFYAHYTDQFDQLKKIEAEFIEGINSFLVSYLLTSPQTEIGVVVGIFEYVKQNKQLCRALLGRNGDIEFQEDLIRVISGCVLSEWQGRLNVDRRIAEYMMYILATGCIGVGTLWLEDDCSMAPEQLATLVVQLANNGIAPFLIDKQKQL